MKDEVKLELIKKNEKEDNVGFVTVNVWPKIDLAL